MSLPRVLTTGTGNQLRMDVPPEFASLRTNTSFIKAPKDSTDLEAGQTRSILHNRAGEVVCTFVAANLDCGLELQIGTAQQVIPLLKVVNGVSIGETPTTLVGNRTLAFSPNEDGHSTLHIWIDGSIIELFLYSAQVMTMRSYLTPEAGHDIHVRWTGHPQSLIALMTSNITSVSSD